MESQLAKYLLAFGTVCCIAPTLCSQPGTFSPASQRSPTVPKRKTKVDVRYDKKKALTTVRLEELILWKNPIHFEQIGMIVEFDYPQRIIVTPKTVSIVFHSATRDGRPFPTDSLVALLDGIRLDLGEMEGGDGNLGPGRSFLERRRISISYQDFSRITQAKKVVMLVGDRKYDLSDEQVQSLRDFLEFMQQEGQEFK
jgi:hypothetical protein